MRGNLLLRSAVGILLILAISQGWWYVALPLGIVGSWFFDYYLEMLLAGLIYDSLFGMAPGMGLRGYLGIVVAAVTLVLVTGMKGMVRR